MRQLHPRAAARRGHAASIALVLTAILSLIWLPVGAEGTQRVDAYLKGLTSLEADFAQFTFNADRTRMMEGRGTFYLQRPGRFRWQYETPGKQVIIADGKRVYLHDLELDQVSHQSEEKALRGTPALLLANNDPIDRHFTAKPIDSTDGREWVELTPKAADTDVIRIELGFGDTGIESMIMEDSFGQTTRLNFTEIKRNPSLDAALFEVDEKAGGDFLSFD